MLRFRALQKLSSSSSFALAKPRTEQQVPTDESLHTYDEDEAGELLQACIQRRDLAEGKRIHNRILKCGHHKDVYLGSLLMSMYGKCGGTAMDVLNAFHDIQYKNVVSWNGLISATGLCKGEALRCFHNMLQHGDRPNVITYVSLLKVGVASRALQDGEWIHARVREAGFESDMVVRNVLVDLYGKCGRLEAALDIFNNTLERNIVTWTSMLAAFCKVGHFQDALEFYRNLLQDGESWPSKITFIAALGAAASLSCLKTGNFIREHVVASGLCQDLEVGNSLVNLYGKVGAVDEALEVFQAMPLHDVISWNALFSAFAQNGYSNEALSSFKKMLLEGASPEASTFTIISGAATEPFEAANIELCTNETGLEGDIAVANALVSMNSKCGRVGNADAIFQGMPLRNAISWNSVITAHAQGGDCEEAMQLFREMQMEGVTPDKFTLISILDICSQDQGKQIHGCIAETSVDLDVVVANALINMYRRFGFCKEAREVFSVVQQQCNVVSWTSLLRAYVQEGFTTQAFELFRKMLLEAVRPTVHTYCLVLSACTSHLDVNMGRMIQHCVIECGLRDTTLDSAMISMLSRCCGLKDSLEAFEIADSSNTSLTRKHLIKTSLITALVEHGFYHEALEAFREILLEGMKPDRVALTAALNACSKMQDSFAEGKKLHSLAVENMFEPTDLLVCSALVSMYAKSGHTDVALRTLMGVDMSHKNAALAADMWNAFLSPCIYQQDMKTAVLVFHRMQLHGVRANRVTFLMLLNACITQANSRLGKLLHCCATECGLEHNSFVKTALVDMHGKLGNLSLARDILDGCSNRTAAWNAMASAYSLHGRSEETQVLFWKLQQAGHRPNEATFTSVLSASTGIIQANNCFSSMVIDHSIAPLEEHYRLMIQLLCQAGRIVEARELVVKVPLKMRAILQLKFGKGEDVGMQLSKCRIGC